MTKKDFKVFAERIAKIENQELREEFINFLLPLLKEQNNRFDEIKFIDYINKKRL